MFESISIRHQRPLGASDPIDVSFLAEAMMFYGNVHVLADINIVEQLISAIGPRVLVELFEERVLNISYLVQQPCLVEFPDFPNSGLTPAPVSLSGWGRDLEQIAPELFAAVAGNSDGRHLGGRFADLVPTVDTGSEDIGPDLFGEVKADFLDTEYVHEAVVQLLAAVAPEYRVPQQLRFQVQKKDLGVLVDTNIDFELANASFKRQPEAMGWSLSAATILLYLLEARCDLYFASQLNTELATHPGRAAIINAKWQDILKTRSQSEHKIEAFQEMIVQNAYEIGETLRCGYRTWPEFLLLLKQARKFKVWLQQQPPDVQLTREYLRALEKDTWISSLPVKRLRFLVFTAASLFLPTPLGIGLSAADGFLVDRIGLGWRPNQFVNGALKGFLRMD